MRHFEKPLTRDHVRRVFLEADAARNRQEWLGFWRYIGRYKDKRNNLVWFQGLGIPFSAQGDLDMAVEMFRALYSPQHETGEEPEMWTAMSRQLEDSEQPRFFLQQVLLFVFRNLLTGSDFKTLSEMFTEKILKDGNYTGEPLPYKHPNARYSPWNNTEQEPERFADITMLFASKVIAEKIIERDNLVDIELYTARPMMKGWCMAVFCSQLFWNSLQESNHKAFRRTLRGYDDPLPETVQNWASFWERALQRDDQFENVILRRLVHEQILHDRDFWGKVLYKNPVALHLALCFLKNNFQYLLEQLGRIDPEHKLEPKEKGRRAAALVANVYANKKLFTLNENDMIKLIRHVFYLFVDRVLMDKFTKGLIPTREKMDIPPEVYWFISVLTRVSHHFIKCFPRRLLNIIRSSDIPADSNTDPETYGRFEVVRKKVSAFLAHEELITGNPKIPPLL